MGDSIAGKTIQFVERNHRGAWVIYGVIGIRQYYGYTKDEAAHKYKEEAYSTIFTSNPKK